MALPDALAFSVNVQVRLFSPPLEHAPDQIASRPFETLRVMDVLTLNDALPVLPTGTLMPAGVESTRSPLLPLAVTVNVAVCPGGFTVSAVDRVTPLYVADSVTGVDSPTLAVVTLNVVPLAPAGTVTVEGAAAAAPLLESDTTAPPAGAADVSATVPVDVAPPITLDGLTLIDDSDAGADAACGVKRRTDENGPNTPAELRPRTRHHSRCAGSPLSVTWEAVTVTFATNGELIVDELSTCTS